MILRLHYPRIACVGWERKMKIKWVIIFTGIMAASASLNAETVSSASSQQSISVMIKNGRYTEVIDKIEAFADLEKNWRANFWLGTAYLLNGQLTEAAYALDYAIELKGDIAELWLQRAIVEQEKNNPGAALRLLNIALHFKPDYAEVYLNIAYAYEFLGKPDLAASAYARFLKLSSKNIAQKRLRQQILTRLLSKQKKPELYSKQ